MSSKLHVFAAKALGYPATLLGLALAITSAQGATEQPGSWGQTLGGVLTCTLEVPRISGDARLDQQQRNEYERRPDRVVRLRISSDGRTASLSTPLAQENASIALKFIADRNVFNLFVEQNTLSSSVYAVSRGIPLARIAGELVHMSASSGGFARKYECVWEPVAQ